MSLSVGEWMLTTRGVTSTPAGDKPITFWFCPKTSCTTNKIVVRQISKLSWGTPQGCLPGTMVSVFGDMTETEEQKIVRSAGVVIKRH